MDPNTGKTPDNNTLGDLQVPQRIHHSAFTAAAESAERLGLLLQAQVLHDAAKRAMDAGGWLE